ncbi:MAG: class I SAM-dependent methyltransferase [bacterium]|nr:class I SAM-dependent methyltransferase [bacterium]
MQFDLPQLKYAGESALAPKGNDLTVLYKLIKHKKPTTVLELGCGYSTIVIEQALIENKQKSKACAIDTNKEWIKEVARHTDNVNYLHSPARMRVWNTNDGTIQRMYHLFDTLPKIKPDFVYIDGPAPKEVINWKMPAVPISFDLYYYERIFDVGTTVLIDGRVVNTVWLYRILKRPWAMIYSFEADMTIMQLVDKEEDVPNVQHEILEWINENA